MKHDYELAVASFQKAMEDERYFFPEMIYLYHIESTLEKEIVTNLVQRHFIEELKKRYDSNLIVLYEYFQMKKNKIDPMILERYIWEKCRFIICDFYPRNVIIDILTTELKQLASITDNTQYIYQFNHYIKKTE